MGGGGGWERQLRENMASNLTGNQIYIVLVNLTLSFKLPLVAVSRALISMCVKCIMFNAVVICLLKFVHIFDHIKLKSKVKTGNYL